MIILLDTSTPLCKVSLVDGDIRFDHEWQADRGLAKGLLVYIRDQLSAHHWGWSDITGIGVFRGPGSFTGLRIGLTVLNTIADAQKIPIVGVIDDNWQTDAIMRLNNGDNDQIVLPVYGSDAHITLPRK